ncbi:MAG TPA: diguanylate cyclase [Rhodocyclaceae bacterium]|nr:diguanylate cyclase [Rhodocyclaceae bacterium]
MPPPLDVTKFEQLKASGDLPSPKGIALAVMRLIQQDDVSMPQLASVIRTDPAFVGRLIKAANGVLGFGRRPIASVHDALTVLGMPAVRTMALGFSLLTNYRSGACTEFDYGRYWSCSLVMAVTTQALSQRTRAAAPDETYCLGLLARVGELALATLYPKDYSQILSDARSKNPAELLEMEERAFAMNHAELGAGMLADWGLPRVFTDAAYHANREIADDFPEGSREYVMTQSLSIAMKMGNLCLSPEASRPAMMRQVLALGSRLSFDEETMNPLCDAVVREWMEWGALLNVHAEQLPPFESLSKQAVEPTASVAKAEPELKPEPPAIAVPAAATVQKQISETAPPLRVLVAESDAAARDAIKAALLEAGYEVAEAKDGFMATELALDFQPDMMLVASSLPDIKGDELVRTLRKTRIGRSIYVLAMNERADEDALIHAFESGIDDVISKPVNSRLLLARVRAGKRLTSLHHEIENDREEIRHFAAELAVSNRRLHDVALTDSLTGFPNRRYFTDRLMQEWVASSRSKRPLSCVMVDIDKFKAVNDTYGHDVGDSVLRQVAAAIRSGLRAHDVVARTGGDEFLIMCPDTALEAAMACAERVKQAVQRAEILCGVVQLKVTLSIGVATRDAPNTDPDTLIKRADQGLYMAKQAGRNCVASAQLRPVRVEGA